MLMLGLMIASLMALSGLFIYKDNKKSKDQIEQWSKGAFPCLE